MPQTLKCPSCAAPLQYDGRSPSIKCDYCNNITLIPEEYRHTSSSSQNIPFGSSSGIGDFSQSLPLDKLVEINDKLHNGRKIEAIKIFRETFGVGLKEAKEAVEQLERGEAINLSGQQKIMAFHDSFDADQMAVNMDRSEMVINIDPSSGQVRVGNAPAGNVPRPVVLGGSGVKRQNSGCVASFLGQFGCLLFLFFWIPFLIVMVGTLIFPPMVVWAAPLACDDGYTDAYAERVGYYSTGNFEGNNIVLLHCVYGDGVDEIPHPFKVDGIIFAGPMAILAVVAFGIAFFGSIRTSLRT
jgi:LSD1 subclass zinc finger protein